MDKHYWKLYWLDGKTEIVEGSTISIAFTNAGYGGGAIRALDYYEPVDKNHNSICEN